MKPKVIVHSATTLDGRVDGFVPDIETYYSLTEELGEDATLVGSNTMLAAFPPEEMQTELEVTPERMTITGLPMLVSIDSRGRIKNWNAWKLAANWGLFISLCSESTPEEHLAYLKEEGVEALVVGENHVDIAAALELLNEKYGVQTVRVDAGGELNGVLFRAGVVDEVSIVLHPILAGEPGTTSLFREPGQLHDRYPVHLQFLSIRQIYRGLMWLRYKVKKSS